MSAEPFSPDIPSEPSTFCTRRRRWVSSLGGAGCALLVLLNMVLMGLATLLTLMLAVTIGATAAKKHPILLAIAVYYGLSLVRMAACLNAANACTSSGATLAALAGVNAAAILIAYFWMYYLTSRKLNLS